MALINDAPRIAAQLATIAGVQSVTRGWPKEQARLPCVAITEASNRAVDHRDDAESLTELEYYIRVFAKTHADVDALVPGVDATMTLLGYARTFCYEEGDAGIKQRVFRYRAYR